MTRSSGLCGGFRFRRSARGHGVFFSSRHSKLSFRGDRRGHDMDHSCAPEKQANSAVSQKSDGKTMAAGAAKSSHKVLMCPQTTGHSALDPR